MTQPQAPYTTDDLDNPRPGYYLAPVVKGGPLVPQKIVIEAEPGGHGFPALYVGHEPASDQQDLLDRWPYLMDKAVPEAVYQYALDNIAYHQAHDPSNPLARPYEAVSFGHNLPPGDEIVAAERLVENAENIHGLKNPDQPPTADIAERAINAVKQLRAVASKLDDKIKSTRKAAKAAADAELADHLHMYGELDKWKAAMQAIAHEARSTSDGNITTLLGVTASQKQTVAVEVVDWSKVPEHYYEVTTSLSPKVLEVARAAHKAGEPLPDIPGVKITVVKSTVVS